MSTVGSTEKTQSWGDIKELMNGSQGATQTAGQNGLANKEVFMQLLVAQLKNQDPMSPADGIQFVTQLAQFTQLEQSMGMRQDVQAIRDVLTQTTEQQTEQP
jgi:flagellar basal-body rod modification protein FlgD